MSLIFALMLTASPPPATAADLERCMLHTGQKWSKGSDAADVIGRAVRAHCAPVEARFIEASLAQAKPDWDADKRNKWREFVTRTTDAFGDGLENKVVAMVVERRAK